MPADSGRRRKDGLIHANQILLDWRLHKQAEKRESTCHVSVIWSFFQVEDDETARGVIKKGADSLSAFALVEQMLECFGGHSERG
jgi:hypothetical protein